MPDFGDILGFYTPLSVNQGVSPLWRLVVTDLEGATVTVLDKLASGRRITPLLDAPLVGTFDVPSDNPEVNIRTPDPEDLPFLNEGVRLCYWLRREKETPQYYYPRGSTIILQTEDTAEQDDSVTHVTCYDPWHYLYYVPLFNADGELPQTNLGVSFDDSMPSYIVPQLLYFALLGSDSDSPDAARFCFIDTGPDYTGTSYWGGYYDPAMTQIDIGFERGWSIGQCWDKLISEGYCDIVLTPVYDPVNRPGILCDLSVYTRAGVTRPEAIFAWDRPGRNLSQISRLVDGTVRANKVKTWAGTGGSAEDGTFVPLQTDNTSLEKYGEYWALQNTPGMSRLDAEVLAANMLFYRKNFREIVNYTPAPERAPRPFQDYGLGDHVITSASDNLRESIPPGNVTPEAYFQRIYGFPIAISDDALETVEGMLLAPSEGAGA